MLTELATTLRAALGIHHKRDIQTAAAHLQPYLAQQSAESAILLGDDCAAIPQGDAYLLLAAEGMWPTLVETEPWFAGWCAILVNVSDIYAMGGQPIAVVDTLWTVSEPQAEPLWQGMMAAAKTFEVPIVGGHTNCHSPYAALSVAILGRAKRLITSFDAQPGHTLLWLGNLEGRSHPIYPFWDAATMADPATLRRQLALLPTLANQGLCQAGKDISMGGVIGTTLMLIETSGCGAVLDIAAIPRPAEVPLDCWLLSFPSYGFLLSVSPEQVPTIQTMVAAEGLACAAIGSITTGHTLTLTLGTESIPFWDTQRNPLTGFSSP